MKLYFDTAYLAKCYWNEPDGVAVRAMARGAEGLFSSAICIAEMACVAHRKGREGQVTRVEAVTRALPADCFLRACDALHLVTASDAGFTGVWTNDRHMLTAAPYFGLTGNTV